MINAYHGTAHSLAQSQFVGKTKAAEGVVAGMIVRKNATGEIVKGVSGAATAVDDLVGFAINGQSDTDVLGSGAIGAYSLDGSILGSDQTQSDTAINATNYPVGKRISASTSEAGKFKPWASTERALGQVVGIDTLYNGQTPVTVLKIKTGDL